MHDYNVTVSSHPPAHALGRPQDACRRASTPHAKKSYTARYVAASLDADPQGYHLLAGADVVPAAGDIVLARAALPVDVVDTFDLCDPAVATGLLTLSAPES